MSATGGRAEGSGWPSGWSRGVLDAAILAVLAGEPAHGYAIGQSLQARGFGRITGGGLYPVLARLEEAGHLAFDWDPGDSGPARKVYRLTSDGREALAEHDAAWSLFTTAMDDLLPAAARRRREP